MPFRDFDKAPSPWEAHWEGERAVDIPMRRAREFATRDPYVRWGNGKAIVVPATTVPVVVPEFVFYEVEAPCETIVRLAAYSPHAPVAGFNVTWSVLIGLGSFMDPRTYLIPVAPSPGTAADFTFTTPARIVRISASVVAPVVVGSPNFDTTVSAMVAPVTGQFQRPPDPSRIHQR